MHGLVVTSGVLKINSMRTLTKAIRDLDTLKTRRNRLLSEARYYKSVGLPTIEKQVRELASECYKEIQVLEKDTDLIAAYEVMVNS